MPVILCISLSVTKNMKTGYLLEHFPIIKASRQSWKIEHKLFNILLLIICAVTAGTDG